MVTVPPVTPLTTPVDATTVATAVLLLSHVPPVAELVNVIVVPVQTTVGPERVPALGKLPTVIPFAALAVPQAFEFV